MLKNERYLLFASFGEFGDEDEFEVFSNGRCKFHFAHALFEVVAKDKGYFCDLERCGCAHFDEYFCYSRESFGFNEVRIILRDIVLDNCSAIGTVTAGVVTNTMEVEYNMEEDACAKAAEFAVGCEANLFSSSGES